MIAEHTEVTDTLFSVQATAACSEHCAGVGKQCYAGPAANNEMKLYHIERVLCLAVVCWAARAACGTVSVLEDASANDINQPKVASATSSEQTDVEHKVKNSIRISGDHFLLNGERLHIVAGSLHYFRAPAAYWRDRLMMLKAAGLNTVSTYVEWSYHETEERQYDFEGDRDIAHFIQLAAEVGLHVLLRPGPYICAERDLGGLPYWLLGKYPNIKLRTVDKDFMNETKTWLDKLFAQVSPLLFGNGGPVILVQVENEYGSYSNDKKYMGQLRDLILSHVQQDALLYTTDGSYPSMFTNGAIEGALTTIDFGTGANIPDQFRELRKYMPKGPLMNSEYYPGWLTHWGERFQRVPTQAVVKTLKDMMDNEINLNFYMFFGGSNFEFTAGANFGSVYQPDITSYDYDAPMSEAGDPTDKYYAIRNALKSYFPDLNNTPVPKPSLKANYGTVPVQPVLKLLSNEGRTALGKRYSNYSGSRLPTFEKLRQRSGLVLYEAIVHFNSNNATQWLSIAQPRDRVYVFVNDVLQGTLSRMHSIYEIPIATANEIKLSLLVENQGRINYGNKLHDFKGILSSVEIGKTKLDGEWSITGFPLEAVNISSGPSIEELTGYLQNGPVMYEGFLTLPNEEEPKDTFIDPSGWGKGYIWINGHNLGRYWPNEGPQVTLYLPGVWLKAAPAKNHLQILELESSPSSSPTLKFLNTPILN